jgi:hypothetical protein
VLTINGQAASETLRHARSAILCGREDLGRRSFEGVTDDSAVVAGRGRAACASESVRVDERPEKPPKTVAARDDFPDSSPPPLMLCVPDEGAAWV